MADLAILIPAAGRAARMRGRDKLLETVDGVPLLRRQAALALGLRVPVLVTLRCERGGRAEALLGLEGIEPRIVENADDGISASVSAGAAWAERLGAEGLMVLLADLPDLLASDLESLREAFSQDPRSIIRATDAAGRPGHPVVLPARLFKRLLSLRGDQGALAVLSDEPVKQVVLPGNRATTDLDTPEDWAEWRARHPDRKEG